MAFFEEKCLTGNFNYILRWVQLFLMDIDFELRDQLIEKSWLTTALAYLLNIFNRLNDLNK